MISMGEEGVTPRQRYGQLTAGLGLIEGVIIDQHFAQRARYGRLMSMVAASPNLIGVGIDEDTAIEVRDRRFFTVHGSGRVFVLDCPPPTPTPPTPAAAHRSWCPARWCTRCPQALRSTSPRFASSTSSRSTPMSRWPSPRPRPDPPPSHCPTRKEIPWQIAPPPPVPLHPSWASSSRGSTAAGTSGPTARRSTSSSTSGCSRATPPTPSTGSPTGSSSCCPGWRTTPARAGVKGGFIERMREGTWLGHVAEHVALQLQQEAGHDLRRGKTRAVKGQTGALQRHLRLQRRGRRPGRRHARRPAGQPPRAGRGGLRLHRGARRLPAAGPADRLRAVHRRDPRGGGLAGHPLHPAQRGLARPARPGRPRPADPRHHDLARPAPWPSTSPATRT